MENNIFTRGNLNMGKDLSILSTILEEIYTMCAFKLNQKGKVRQMKVLETNISSNIWTIWANSSQDETFYRCLYFSR